MERFITFADKLSVWFGHTFAWLIMLMTFGVSYEVFVRYVLGAPTPWAFDVTYIMYGTLFMMAGAYTLSQDGHVRADFIYRLLEAAHPGGGRDGALLPVLLPRHPRADLRRVEVRAPLVALPRGQHHEPGRTSRSSSSRRSIVVAGVLIFIQGVAQVFRCIICIRTGAWPGKLEDVEELEQVLIKEHEREVAPHGPEAADAAGPEGRAR